jgi:hypothetical protein
VICLSTLHTTIQSYSMFIVLVLFTLVSAMFAVNPLGSAIASSNGGSGGAGHLVSSSTSGTTSSPPSNSHGSKGSAVILIPVNSGDPALDKQINKFYSCISKTHMDPPTKDQLDSCYFQNVGGQSSGSQSSGSQSSGSHTQSQKISKSKIASSPPGMLVEVP